MRTAVIRTEILLIKIFANNLIFIFRSDWDLHNTKLGQTLILDDPLLSCDCENVRTTSIIGESELQYLRVSLKRQKTCKHQLVPMSARLATATNTCLMFQILINT